MRAGPRGPVSQADGRSSLKPGPPAPEPKIPSRRTNAPSRAIASSQPYPSYERWLASGVLRLGLLQRMSMKDQRFEALRVIPKT